MTDKIAADNSHAQHGFPDDDVDWGRLLLVFWRGKWLILFLTIVFAAGAVYFAINLPNIYRANTLLAPSQSQGAGLSSQLKQLGGLASFAGVDVGGSDSNKTDLALSILQSRKFLTAFVAKYELAPALYASIGWDQGNNALIYDETIYDPASGRWRIKGQDTPTDWQLYKEISESLSVSEDENGMVIVSLEHYSPKLAAQWLEWMIADLNAAMKDRDVSEAKRSIEYLEGQLGRTAVADMRAVFYQLIEEQTKTLMLAGVQKEYVLMMVDPPVAPEDKVKPKRALIGAVGTLFGFFLGVVFIFIRDALQTKEA